MVPICCVCVCVCACVCVHACVCMRAQAHVCGCTWNHPRQHVAIIVFAVDVFSSLATDNTALAGYVLLLLPVMKLRMWHTKQNSQVGELFGKCGFRCWKALLKDTNIQNRTAKWESYLASVALGVERLYWRTLTYKTEQPSGRGIWQVWLNVLKGFTEGTAVSLREGLNRWVQLMGSCVHPGF